MEAQCRLAEECPTKQGPHNSFLLPAGRLTSRRIPAETQGDWTHCTVQIYSALEAQRSREERARRSRWGAGAGDPGKGQLATQQELCGRVVAHFTNGEAEVEMPRHLPQRHRLVKGEAESWP